MISDKTETAKKWFLQPVAVPLAQGDGLDLRKVQLAASSVVSSRPRSFEIFWDGTSFELCFGAPTKEDLNHMVENYRQHVKVGVVDESAGLPKDSSEYPAPKWLSQLDPSTCRLLFLGNAYGHAYCLYDVKRTGRLMTPLLLALQRSRFAWVQFLWFERPLQKYLSSLGSRMRDKFIEIDQPIPKVRSWRDEDGKLHTERYTVDHPAKFGEFHTNFKRMDAHIMGKSGSRSIVIIGRGLLQPHEGMEMQKLPFAEIEDSDEVKQPHDLPFRQVMTQTGEGKIGERLQEWLTTDPRMIIDLVERRVFDVDREMGRYVESYLRDRRGLPFTIFTADEMGLIAHPPSSDIRGLRTTRQSELPPPRSNRVEKPGIQITTG